MRDAYESSVEGASAKVDRGTAGALRRLAGMLGQAAVLRNFGVYIIGSILGTSVPFLLLPILTRFLAPADYGLVAMFQVLSGICAALTGLSVQGAIGRRFFEADIEFSTYVANCFLILCATAVLLTLLTYSFADSISAAAAFPKDWLWAVIVQAVCQFITSVTLVVWQIRGKAVPYAIYMVSLIGVNVGASLVFVILGGLGWRGRVMGQILAYAAFAAIGLVILGKGKWIRPRVNWAYIRNALAFGAPLVPHALGMWAITMAGRWLVAREVGLHAAGIYLVGAQVGTIIGLFQDAFNKAWVPWFYRELNKGTDEAKLRIVRITYVYNLGIMLLALGVSVSAPWALRVLAGPEYGAAAQIVPWIAFGYAFNGMYKMVTNYTFYVGKTYFLAAGTFITGVINIGCGYALVKANGAVGAAQATALSFCVSYVFTAIIASRLVPMPSVLRRA